VINLVDFLINELVINRFGIFDGLDRSLNRIFYLKIVHIVDDLLIIEMISVFFVNFKLFFKFFHQILVLTCAFYIAVIF
jgi:hypothetical protein